MADGGMEKRQMWMEAILGVGAGICGAGGTLGSGGRMDEKSSGRCGRGRGGRMEEKSRVGFVASGVGDCCFGSCLGLSWLKISASWASALLVSVPNCSNGVAGAGLRSKWVRSFAVSMTNSADEVAGMVTW